MLARILRTVDSDSRGSNLTFQLSASWLLNCTHFLVQVPKSHTSHSSGRDSGADVEQKGRKGSESPQTHSRGISKK